MQKNETKINTTTLPVISANTIIIGSGAAALNAAVSLHESGQEDIAIVTDNWGGGTSNNAGSDKQTYYKLSLAGKNPDSPSRMGEDLFNGGCMHGDIALCESQHSAQAFFHLVQLGVPFPHDKYGGYIGYKTDHDKYARGTSAGPLTSHLMFEALARDVRKKGITVYDKYEVVELLTEIKNGKKHSVGAIALDKTKLDSSSRGFVLFNTVNIILSTGGPAGIYKASVYPKSQTGSTGMALKIGAIGNNLTESQFGIASIKFRWNLSGTYQQVIPRYFSTDQDGNDEREFLNDYFPDMGKLATAIFLKGYQWPFDPRKVSSYGSSLIDILVYHETVSQKRRVFLDYTRNPKGNDILRDFSFDCLEKEASDYLKKSGANRTSPIERLRRMNQPAIDLYSDHGIDIASEYLEIAVCAQHNNGGLKGNIWWESNIRHLFPVGEVNGTHGVYRPGGSALNAGQVGSLRAAMFIAKRYSTQPPAQDEFEQVVQSQVERTLSITGNVVDCTDSSDFYLLSEIDRLRERMSAFGAHIRNPNHIAIAVSEGWEQYRKLKERIRTTASNSLPLVFKALDLCLTHAIYLEAIAEYISRGGASRGSYIVLDPDGKTHCDELGKEWRFSINDRDDFVNRKILEISLDTDDNVIKNWVDPRPIPDDDLWFENVWQDYRDGNVI
ncbi:MAG: FAD-binding protein [Calditrichaeota bacterium]|nr:FAD-binding protein [Calditrichota bacterium]